MYILWFCCIEVFISVLFFISSFIKSLNDDAVQCRMGHSASDTLVLTQLIVIIDYNTRLFLKDNEGGFQFVPNPEVADRNEEEGKVLKR